MEALKKTAENVTGGNSSQGQPQDQAQGLGQTGDVRNEDYVDKAFAAGVKKSGYNISREQQEKITDTGRYTHKKATGH